MKEQQGEGHQELTSQQSKQTEHAKPQQESAEGKTIFEQKESNTTGRTRLAFKNEQSLDEFAVLCLQNGVPFAQGADLSISMQNRVFEELPPLVSTQFTHLKAQGEASSGKQPPRLGKRLAMTPERSREALRKLVPEKFRPRL